MGSVTDDVLIARAYLNRVAEPACIPLWDLVRSVGPLEAAARVRSRDVSADVHAATASRCATGNPHADLEVAARHQIRLVVPESTDWPHFAFAGLERTGSVRLLSYAGGQHRHEEYGEPIPPLALWVRGVGDLSSLGTRSVSIVGARAASPYGIQVASELSYALSIRGFTIVSGGAFGIDAAAHRAALAAGGRTVVVSAGGPHTAYPRAHSGLFDQVAQSGLIVSESPPGSAPQRRRFLTRNRIVAALGSGSIVVEASRRSGAINTAGHCYRLDRPLMVVPGPVTSGTSTGCHDLLRDDAKRAVLVTTVDDVTDLIGTYADAGQRPTSEPKNVDVLRMLLNQVDAMARLVYDGFPARRSVRPDELALVAGLSVRDVIRSLPALEGAGLIEERADGFCRASAVSRAVR